MKFLWIFLLHGLCSPRKITQWDTTKLSVFSALMERKLSKKITGVSPKQLIVRMFLHKTRVCSFRMYSLTTICHHRHLLMFQLNFHQSIIREHKRLTGIRTSRILTLLNVQLQTVGWWRMMAQATWLSQYRWNNLQKESLQIIRQGVLIQSITLCIATIMNNKSLMTGLKSSRKLIALARFKIKLQPQWLYNTWMEPITLH